MKNLIKKVCFALLLVTLSLTACTSVFAESLEDVLKDCKLDRSRWKVVEWFKADKFVRFYDPESVSVTGPGQFDAVICDYFYDKTCRQSNCVRLGSKHYHREKWGFNTAKSTGTLRSFSLEDAKDTLDAYEYPLSMQIETDLKRNGLEDKTMQKIKEQVKGDKDFAAEPKTSPASDSQTQNAAPKIKGLVPLPMEIGASDGEWTYLGRFIPPGNYSTLLEWETRMMPYTGSAETDNLYDVYYYHSHYGNGDGQGCLRVEVGNGQTAHFGFSCVLKFVSLDRNGRPEKKSGGPHGIYLFSMRGGARGTFAAEISRVRIFDSVTHQQLTDITDTARDRNPNINGRFFDTDYKVLNIRNNSPFYKAMHMTRDSPNGTWDIP